MRRKSTGAGRALLTGLGIGAVVMYVFDPDMSGRRTGLIRDKAESALRHSDEFLIKAGRDLANRTRGLGYDAVSVFRNDEADDAVLEARVRTALGRLVSHPGALQVIATNGSVIVEGPVLEAEVNQLLNGVRDVRGVRTVVNHLQPHKTTADVAALQGAGRPRPQRFELAQENWSPTARLLVGVAGLGLLRTGMSRRGWGGLLAAAAGTTLLARAGSNTGFGRLVGVTGGRMAVQIQKTINLNAPVEQVFAAWSKLENFPRFMPHIREVRQTSENRTHWSASVAPGISVEWDALTTRLVPNQLIAWRSDPGSIVPNAGMIHFSANEKGGTRVDMRVSYNPPAGALGHAVAKAFGADLKSRLDEDLVRFKSLLETGKATVHGQEVRREELAG